MFFYILGAVKRFANFFIFVWDFWIKKEKRIFSVKSVANFCIFILDFWTTSIKEFKFSVKSVANFFIFVLDF